MNFLFILLSFFLFLAVVQGTAEVTEITEATEATETPEVSEIVPLPAETEAQARTEAPRTGGPRPVVKGGPNNRRTQEKIRVDTRNPRYLEELDHFRANAAELLEMNQQSGGNLLDPREFEAVETARFFHDSHSTDELLPQWVVDGVHLIRQRLSRHEL